MRSVEELNKTYCVIKIKERLDGRWRELFDGMEITVVEGGTTISGTVTDQSAFHGLLNTIRDLGLTLVAVEQKA